MITNLKLSNFQLFRNAEITLDKLNVITGTNLDSDNSSSNGSGKSTLAKSAITFCLYGDVSGINLKDLVSFGEKKCSVTIECSLNNEHIFIKRSIPTIKYKNFYPDKGFREL